MKKSFLFLLILFIILGGTSWLLLSPYLSKIQGIKLKIQQSQAKLDEFRLLSRQSGEMEKKLSLFQKDVQHLGHYLPRREETDSISRILRSQGREYGLTIIKADSEPFFSLEMLTPSSDTIHCLEIIPFHLQLEGRFADICRYLEWLEGLPHFFGIDNLEILKQGKDYSPAPRLQMNMTLQVFGLSRKGKARYFQREAKLYQPVHLSSALITAQKNLRITNVAKDLFALEQSILPKQSILLEQPVLPKQPRLPEQDIDMGEQDKAKARARDNAKLDNESPGEKYQEAPLTDMNLSGIVSYQGEYMALINNQRVRKGDIIAEMEVIWITKDGVGLAKGSEKILLRLNK